MAELRFSGVSKRFGPTQAVSELDLRVADGELVVLLGPTGAGKTTTLRLAAGLVAPDAGRVLIGGRDATSESPAERDIAFVFQQYSLYPHLSVYDNLAFPLRSPRRRVPEAVIAQRVGQVARLLRIQDRLRSRATQLSGGQMQRVAIGRALVRRPAVYLMDEPLSSLDAQLRAELRIELRRIQGELGATILYVTHDQTEAMTLATHVGVLDQGRLIQFGRPREIYENPRNVAVATRLGSPTVNVVPRELFPGLSAPPRTATIGVRTEQMLIRPPGPREIGGATRGRVRRIEHLGAESHLRLTLGAGAELVTLVDPRTDLQVGDAVEIELRDPFFFDNAGERLSHDRG